jgi:hypothetical protein
MVKNTVPKNYSIYIILFIILAVAWFLKNRYNEKLDREYDYENYSIIQQYLLTDSTQFDTDIKKKNKKPIIWIPIKYEYNSRNWLSWGSRSSMDLNQPYMYLTVRSIINQCSRSFNICLVDDNSFSKLIPGWTIDMKIISSPVLDYMRQLGLVKLIHIYGGMIVPPSFLCMRNLDEMYRVGTSGNKMFVCENNDRNITSTTHEFYPNINFMGAGKQNRVLGQLIEFMQHTISSDYTSQMEFLGEINRWCEFRIRSHEINMVDGKLIGIKNMEDEPILIDNLLSNEYIDVYPQCYGIYIPADEILKRRHYEWFSRLSAAQILESRTIICKYILLASTPDSKKGVIEPMRTKPTWISYWKIPSGAPYWGLKPNYLGNHVHKLKKEPTFNN